MYHRENHQKDFLVLAGECVLVVEGEERPLRAWDFVHCPGGTAHVILGAGEGPSVVIAVGARGGRKGIVYLVDDAAKDRGACSEVETTKSAVAYARFSSRRTTYRDCWLPDDPKGVSTSGEHGPMRGASVSPNAAGWAWGARSANNAASARRTARRECNRFTRRQLRHRRVDS